MSTSLTGWLAAKAQSTLTLAKGDQPEASGDDPKPSEATSLKPQQIEDAEAGLKGLLGEKYGSKIANSRLWTGAKSINQLAHADIPALEQTELSALILKAGYKSRSVLNNLSDEQYEKALKKFASDCVKVLLTNESFKNLSLEEKITQLERIAKVGESTDQGFKRALQSELLSQGFAEKEAVVIDTTARQTASEKLGSAKKNQEAKKYDDAFTELKEAAQLNPTDAETHLLLAKEYFFRKDLDGLAKEWNLYVQTEADVDKIADQVNQMWPNLNKEQQTALLGQGTDPAYQVADQLLKAGRPEIARKFLAQAYVDRAKQLEASSNKNYDAGNKEASAQEGQAAMMAYQDATSLEPNNPKNYQELARLAFINGESDLARSSLKSYIASETNDKELWNFLHNDIDSLPEDSKQSLLGGNISAIEFAVDVLVAKQKRDVILALLREAKANGNQWASEQLTKIDQASTSTQVVDVLAWFSPSTGSSAAESPAQGPLNPQEIAQVLRSDLVNVDDAQFLPVLRQMGLSGEDYAYLGSDYVDELDWEKANAAYALALEKLSPGEKLFEQSLRARVAVVDKLKEAAPEESKAKLTSEANALKAMLLSVNATSIKDGLKDDFASLGQKDASALLNDLGELEERFNSYAAASDGFRKYAESTEGAHWDRRVNYVAAKLQGITQEAYESLAALLRKHPELSSNEKLQDKLSFYEGMTALLSAKPEDGEKLFEAEGKFASLRFKDENANRIYQKLARTRANNEAMTAIALAVASIRGKAEDYANSPWGKLSGAAAGMIKLDPHEKFLGQAIPAALKVLEDGGANPSLQDAVEYLRNHGTEEQQVIAAEVLDDWGSWHGQGNYIEAPINHLIRFNHALDFAKSEDNTESALLKYRGPSSSTELPARLLGSVYEGMDANYFFEPAAVMYDYVRDYATDPEVKEAALDKWKAVTGDSSWGQAVDRFARQFNTTDLMLSVAGLFAAERVGSMAQAAYLTRASSQAVVQAAANADPKKLSVLARFFGHTGSQESFKIIRNGYLLQYTVATGTLSAGQIAYGAATSASYDGERALKTVVGNTIMFGGFKGGAALGGRAGSLAGRGAGARLAGEGAAKVGELVGRNVGHYLGGLGSIPASKGLRHLASVSETSPYGWRQDVVDELFGYHVFLLAGSAAHGYGTKAILGLRNLPRRIEQKNRELSPLSLTPALKAARAKVEKLITEVNAQEYPRIAQNLKTISNLIGEEGSSQQVSAEELGRVSRFLQEIETAQEAGSVEASREMNLIETTLAATAESPSRASGTDPEAKAHPRDTGEGEVLEFDLDIAVEESIPPPPDYDEGGRPPSKTLTRTIPATPVPPAAPQKTAAIEVPQPRALPDIPAPRAGQRPGIRPIVLNEDGPLPDGARPQRPLPPPLPGGAMRPGKAASSSSGRAVAQAPEGMDATLLGRTKEASSNHYTANQSYLLDNPKIAKDVRPGIAARVKEANRLIHQYNKRAEMLLDGKTEAELPTPLKTISEQHVKDAVDFTDRVLAALKSGEKELDALEQELSKSQIAAAAGTGKAASSSPGRRVVDLDSPAPTAPKRGTPPEALVQARAEEAPARPEPVTETIPPSDSGLIDKAPFLPPMAGENGNMVAEPSMFRDTGELDLAALRDDSAPRPAALDHVPGAEPKVLVESPAAKSAEPEGSASLINIPSEELLQLRDAIVDKLNKLPDDELHLKYDNRYKKFESDPQALKDLDDCLVEEIRSRKNSRQSDVRLFAFDAKQMIRKAEGVLASSSGEKNKKAIRALVNRYRQEHPEDTDMPSPEDAEKVIKIIIILDKIPFLNPDNLKTIKANNAKVFNKLGDIVEHYANGQSRPH